MVEPQHAPQTTTSFGVVRLWPRCFRTVWPVATSPNLEIDEINSMLREPFPGTGNRCIELGPGYAVAAYDVQPSDIRPGGFVSGPCQFGIVDCALWFLAFVALKRIEPMAMTSELSIRFLRPAQGKRVICKATLEAVSRRSIVGTAHVWVDGRPDKITAAAQGTYAIPLPR